MTRTTIVLAMLALAGCGGAVAQGSGRREGPLTARDLYPVGEDYIWTYDIDTGTGLPTLGVNRVVDLALPRFSIRSDGERTARVFEVRDEGIWSVDDDVWLLRDPIVVGQEWRSRGGRVARITEAGIPVDVRAGHFEDCIEVRETGSETGPDLRTVYCRDQGPVIVESHQTLALNPQGLTVRGELRAELQRGMEDVEQPEGYDAPPGE